MNHRLIGFLGIGAWVLFWVASVLLAEFRPTYSHIVNTVSELGAVGTPHAAVWNVLGFIIPGILLAVCGAAIANAAADPSPSRTLATVFLIVSGLAIAGQEVGPMKRNPSWRGLHIVSAALLVLTLAASFALRGTLPDGLAERLGDALFCSWFIVMSLKLIRSKPQTAIT